MARQVQFRLEGYVHDFSELAVRLDNALKSKQGRIKRADLTEAARSVDPNAHCYDVTDKNGDPCFAAYRLRPRLVVLFPFTGDGKKVAIYGKVEVPTERLSQIIETMSQRIERVRVGYQQD